MNMILKYPNFSPITPSLYAELNPFLVTLKDGISEFTFLNLCIHRAKYQYEIAKLSDNGFIIRGYDKKSYFFSLIGTITNPNIIDKIFTLHSNWKLLSESIIKQIKPYIKKYNFFITEDRNNADYLYHRQKLETLSGKALHKKRNLANAFTKTYTARIENLTIYNAAAAGNILDKWNIGRENSQNSDYEQCLLALELLPIVDIYGKIIFVNEQPIAFTMGEFLCDNTMFVVHFEKALDEYKGVYQFINQTLVASLPASVTIINREQDLGDEGLRQAKMTYRPFSFTQKYFLTKDTILKNNTAHHTATEEAFREI